MIVENVGKTIKCILDDGLCCSVLLIHSNLGIGASIIPFSMNLLAADLEECCVMVMEPLKNGFISSARMAIEGTNPLPSVEFWLDMVTSSCEIESIGVLYEHLARGIPVLQHSLYTHTHELSVMTILDRRLLDMDACCAGDTVSRALVDGFVHNRERYWQQVGYGLAATSNDEVN